MPYRNNVVAEAEVQAVKAAIATIKAKLPFLAGLSVGERKAIFEMTVKRLAFVQNGLRAAQKNPDRAPQKFEAAEFASDVDLVTVLIDLIAAVERLVAETEAQPLAVGGGAMKEMTHLYTYIKTAAPNTTVVKLNFSAEVYSYVETATANTQP